MEISHRWTEGTVWRETYLPSMMQSMKSKLGPRLTTIVGVTISREMKKVLSFDGCDFERSIAFEDKFISIMFMFELEKSGIIKEFEFNSFSFFQNFRNKNDYIFH